MIEEGVTEVVVGEEISVVETAVLGGVHEVDQNMLVVDVEMRTAEAQEDTRTIEVDLLQEGVKDKGRRLILPCRRRPRMLRTWLRQPT